MNFSRAEIPQKTNADAAKATPAFLAEDSMTQSRDQSKMFEQPKVPESKPQEDIRSTAKGQ